MADDIPSLTLRVLQNIQGELVTMNGKFDTLNERVDHLNDKFDTLNERVDHLNDKFDTLNDKVEHLNDKVDTLNTKVETLDKRFDNFLTFVGRDVQDLKTRVTALEAERKRS